MTPVRDFLPLPEEDFQAAVRRVLALEGGAVDDPDDAGGPTHLGISSRSHPEVDLDTLTAAKAIEIYRRDYWERPGIDRIPDAELASRVLALAVVAGSVPAIRALQRALGRIGIRVRVDGHLGAETCGAVILARGTGHSPCLLAALTVEEVVHYRSAVRARPSNRKWLLGWLNRALAS